MDAARDVSKAGLFENVSAEDEPRLDVHVLQPADEFPALDVSAQRDRKAEPRRIRLGRPARENEVLLVALEPAEIKARVASARLDELRQLLELRDAQRRLHFADLQVVPEIRVNVLVIVAHGQLAELPLETLAARVAHARLAPAIAAPVANGQAGPSKTVFIHPNHPPFAHRQVVR